jgi:hypothetical protein
VYIHTTAVFALTSTCSSVSISDCRVPQSSKHAGETSGLIDPWDSFCCILTTEEQIALCVETTAEKYFTWERSLLVSMPKSEKGIRRSLVPVSSYRSKGGLVSSTLSKLHENAGWTIRLFTQQKATGGSEIPQSYSLHTVRRRWEWRHGVCSDSSGRAQGIGGCRMESSRKVPCRRNWAWRQSSRFTRTCGKNTPSPTPRYWRQVVWLDWNRTLWKCTLDSHTKLGTVEKLHKCT